MTASEENGVIDNNNNHMTYNGPWHLALSGPSYIAAISHSLGRSMREQLYKAACVRRSFEKSAVNDKNKIPLIYEILKVKYKMAQLLVYNIYAELSFASIIALSIQSIPELTNLILDKVLPAANKELDKISQYARDNSSEEYFFFFLVFYCCLLLLFINNMHAFSNHQFVFMFLKDK